MKDLPVFITDNGAASLVLREIPYQGDAYVTIRDSREPEKLLEDCVTLCRAAGAVRVYATGHSVVEKYPFRTSVFRMVCATEAVGDTDAALFPVQEKTLEDWRQLYNKKISHVPNGAWMTQKEAEQMLVAGEGYFVHREGKALGIGRVEGHMLRFVASVEKGAGCDVVRALCHAAFGDTVELVVASSNKKAVRLYERLGFVKTVELFRWHQVL